VILAVIGTIQLVVRQRREEFRREQESNPKLCNAGAVLDHLRTNWELAVIWIHDKSRVYDDPHHRQLPVCLIAQLVEHSTGIAMDQGSNPIHALFSLLLKYCSELRGSFILKFKPSALWIHEFLVLLHHLHKMTVWLRLSLGLPGGNVFVPERPCFLPQFTYR